MIGYKVVREEDGVYWSAWLHKEFPKAALRYEVGRETVPAKMCGPILLFSTFESARNFSDRMRMQFGGRYKILKVNYMASEATEAWNLLIDGKILNIYMPHGTVTASSVTPLEVVP